MAKYVIQVDFGQHGYTIHGGLLRVIWTLLKEKQVKAELEEETTS